MTARAAWASLLALVTLGAQACADLPAISAGTCGNGVIEAGEDCDGDGSGLTCGAANGAAPCRYRCGRGAGASPCPSGWGCGADDVCRAPSGRFVATSQSLGERTGSVALADFDFDGALDVFLSSGQSGVGASAEPRVIFRDKSGAATTAALEHPATAALAVDVDFDGRSDVVVATASSSLTSSLAGVATFLGAGRGFLAVPYSATRFDGHAQLVTISGVASRANHRATLAVLSDGTGSRLHTLEGNGAGGALGTLAGAPGGDSFLLAANLVEGELSPCDEIVFGRVGERTLSLVEVCDALGSLRASVTPRALLAAPAPLTALSLLDVDGDGHVDVVMVTSEGTTVAYGNGVGGFRAVTPLSLVIGGLGAIGADAGGDAAPLDAAVADGGTSALPGLGAALAYGRVGGGVAVATANALLVAKTVDGAGNAAADVAATRLTGSWTAAAIGDVNRDGLDDVVLASSEGSDVDLFLSVAGSSAFSRTRLSSDAPVTRLALVDVDGDGTRDVVFVDAGGALLAAFGQAYGAPLPAVRIANIGATRQIGGAFFDPSSAEETVFAVTNESSERDSLALFVADGHRAMLSPAALSSQDTSGVPLALGVGRFFDPRRLDAVVLALDASAQQGSLSAGLVTRLWTVSSLATREHEVRVGLPLDIAPFGTRAIAAQPQLATATLDADGDGLDELWILTEDSAGKTVLVGARPSSNTEGPFARILLSDVGTVGSGSALLPLDVDHDGRVDLVALVRDATRTSVLILWNDGTFASNNAATLPLDRAALAISSATLDAARGRELLILSQDDLRVAKATGRAVVVVPLDGVQGGSGVAGGDVDGDGVDDLVIVRSSGLALHLGVARTP